MTIPAAEKLILIGCSAGGLDALRELLRPLDAKYNVPIAVVKHIGHHDESLMIDVLGKDINLETIEAVECERSRAGTVSVAPGGYHLLFESDGSFALSLEPVHNGSRPSIDVTFESAANAYAENLVAIVLSGNNQDGSQGIETVLDTGGTVYVQDPAQAIYPRMPEAAASVLKKRSRANGVVASLPDISKIIQRMSGVPNE